MTSSNGRPLELVEHRRHGREPPHTCFQRIHSLDHGLLHGIAAFVVSRLTVILTVVTGE
jgi:hypothetical protein